MTKTQNSGLKIQVKKVLKGDLYFRHKTINIPQCVKYRKDSFLHYFNEIKTKNSIILFKKEWLTKPCKPMLTVFQDDVSDDVKTVLTHLSIHNEEKRLKFLLSLLPTETYDVKRFVFEQFEAMKNPKNFYLFKALVDKNTKCQHKKSALDAMVRTYDYQAVPYLIELLSEALCDINKHAAIALSRQFVGGQGVSEALTKHLHNPNITDTAKRYLAQRYSNPSYQPEPRAPYSYTLGKALLEKGDTEGAVDQFLSYLDTAPDSSSPCFQKYSYEFSGIRAALPYANKKQVDQIYNYLSSLDFNDEAFMFYSKETTAEFFYKYPRLDKSPLILSLLEASPGERKVIPLIILLLNKADDETKKQAHIILEKNYHKEKRYQINNLIGMFWLGHDEFIEQILDNKPQDNKSKLKESLSVALKTMQAIPGHISDYDSLKQAVTEPKVASEWPVISMVIKNLLEYDHPDTPQLLAKMLKLNFKSTSGSIKDAFIEIGTEEVHQMVIEMMGTEDEEIRRFATQTLYELKLEKSLNYMRKALNDPTYGDQFEAAYRLGFVGEIQDINLLSPLCDYWKQPRKLSERACMSINTLRSRYKHDVNGPVIQSPHKNPYDLNFTNPF